MKFTDISIRNLPIPEKGLKLYADDAIPGFGVRVSQGGTKSFILTYGDRRERVTIGRHPIISLADARAETKRILAERTLGKHRPTRMVFDDALRLFVTSHLEQKTRPATALSADTFSPHRPRAPPSPANASARTSSDTAPPWSCCNTGSISR